MMILTAVAACKIYVSCRCEHISEQQQQFSNIPRFTRLQENENLRTHEEDKSDIGTRKIHPTSKGQSPRNLNLVSGFGGCVDGRVSASSPSIL